MCASLTALVLAGLLVTGCGGSDGEERSTATAEPGAGRWQPWVLDTPSDVRVPPPPRAGTPEARGDERALRAAVRSRTPREEARMRAQSGNAVVEPWLPEAMRFVSDLDQ